MKMKINKACDLSSISVLPPPARRSNGVSNGPECSIFGKSHAASSQLRSQQQSFSQGVSSDPGTFSQFSQSSLDEIGMNDQRFGSQDRDNSTKSLSCLPPINNTREESQIQVARSSASLTRRWNSYAPEQRCQINEELEHRIGMIETSLSRFGKILDSVQSDIMQVNKGTKELAMEMEGVRVKLNVNDSSLQLMKKGQEDMKDSLDRSMSSIYDKLNQNMYQEGFQRIFSLLSALPDKIEACAQNLQNDLSKSYTNQIQAMGCSLKIPSQTLTPTVHHPKVMGHPIPQQKRPSVENNCSQGVHLNVEKATASPRIEMGAWTSVKQEATFKRYSNKGHKQIRVSPIKMERVRGLIIESDEEINGGFCCLIEEKETSLGNFLMQEAREETDRILRKARKRKRKHSNTIIID